MTLGVKHGLLIEAWSPFFSILRFPIVERYASCSGALHCDHSLLVRLPIRELQGKQGELCIDYEGSSFLPLFGVGLRRAMVATARLEEPAENDPARRGEWCSGNASKRIGIKKGARRWPQP